MPNDQTELLAFPVSPAEKVALQQRAQEHGQTLTAYVRTACGLPGDHTYTMRAADPLFRAIRKHCGK